MFRALLENGRRRIGSLVDNATGGLWTFLNSSFGLWLLSSIILGYGVWTFDQWREQEKANAAEIDRFDKLSYEAAVRASQFLEWLSLSTLVVQNGDGDWDFASSTQVDDIRQAIKWFGDAPRTECAPNQQECFIVKAVFPEFAESNLLSLYSEMHFIVLRRIEGRTNREFGEIYYQPAFSDPNKIDSWGAAKVALLKPDYLLDYGEPNFDTFEKRFYETFWPYDVARWPFPNSDGFAQ